VKSFCQVLSDIRFFEPLDSDFAAEVADQQILFEGLERTLGEDHFHGPVRSDQ